MDAAVFEAHVPTLPPVEEYAEPLAEAAQALISGRLGILTGHVAWACMASFCSYKIVLRPFGACHFAGALGLSAALVKRLFVLLRTALCGPVISQGLWAFLLRCLV